MFFDCIPRNVRQFSLINSIKRQNNGSEYEKQIIEKLYHKKYNTITESKNWFNV